MVDIIIFFFFSIWPPWTGTTAPFFTNECTEGDGKERIGKPLYFPVPHSAVCISQGASVHCGVPERPGSSFVLYAHVEQGTKMQHQAKVVILQQEKALGCWFVCISTWLSLYQFGLYSEIIPLAHFYL